MSLNSVGKQQGDNIPGHSYLMSRNKKDLDLYDFELILSIYKSSKDLRFTVRRFLKWLGVSPVTFLNWLLK